MRLIDKLKNRRLILTLITIFLIILGACYNYQYFIFVINSNPNDFKVEVAEIVLTKQTNPNWGKIRINEEVDLYLPSNSQVTPKYKFHLVDDRHNSHLQTHQLSHQIRP